MKKNRVSVAVLTAVAVCGAIQSASHAQGGMMLAEPATAPAVRHVPNVVEYPAKPARIENANQLPAPRAGVKAMGHVVHVQDVTNNIVVAPQPVVVAPQAFSMGGFSPMPRSLSSATSAGMPAK